MGIKRKRSSGATNGKYVLKRKRSNNEAQSEATNEAKTELKGEGVDWKGVVVQRRQGAEQAHIAAYGALLARCKKLGYDEKGVDQMLTYIREDAPLVIHFCTHRLLQFAGSTEYTSIFGLPTNANKKLKSSDVRFKAESRLFGGRYDAALGKERVKYGALNISGDPRGSGPAAGYGSAYLLLKRICARASQFTRVIRSR